MKRCLFLLLLAAVSLSIVTEAKPKKQKVDLPAIFDHAQYVHVESYDGDSSKGELFSEDRQAIFNVEKGLHDWNRYAIARRRDQAELAFVVRKGRAASVTPRVEVGNGSHPQNRSPSSQDPFGANSSQGVGVNTEVGPADDMLSVFIVSPSGSLSGPIWSQSMKGGLDMPAMLLLQRIKHDVEAAYPR